MITAADPEAGEFTKRGETAEEADRLGNESRVLAAACHPGVVPRRGFDGHTLRLALVGGQPLSQLVPSPPAAAQIALVAATTLADLHEIGVVHGDLRSDHILVVPPATPVLCSFGHGSTTGGRPAAPTPCAADVVALAHALLDTASVPAAIGGVLATAAAGRKTPTARHLARELAAAAAPDAAPTGRRALRTWGALAVAAVAVAVLVVTLVATRHPARPSAAVDAARPATGRPGMPPCPADDLGCRPVRLDSGVLTTAGGRYRIGGLGDVVVVGHWGCSAALPALLRPATGEVWAWRAWAVAGRPASAHLVARISGAYSLRVGRATAGCDVLQVLRYGQATVVVQPLNSP